MFCYSFSFLSSSSRWISEPSITLIFLTEGIVDLALRLKDRQINKTINLNVTFNIIFFIDN